MSKEILHNRISRFLSEYLPFSYLKEEEILEIAEQTNIRFFDRGEYIFHENEFPPAHFYVIQQGSVELTYQESGQEILFEVLDKGDIFGLKAILGKRKYINSAKAREETLILELPYRSLEKFLQNDPRIALYFAAGFSSGRSIINIGKMEEARKSLNLARSGGILQPDTIHVFKDREVVYCTKETSIREAAEIMTRKKVGSILVLDYEDRPIGIVTDVDFRKKVICQGIDLHKPIYLIMSSPVHTVRKDITLAETLITMMQKNIRHLCVTRDGTDQTPVEGIITEHDVLLLQGNTPAILIKEIYNSDSISSIATLRNQAEELMKTYLEEELSISFIFEMITLINDALIQRLIWISQRKMEEEGWKAPEIKFVWISLGSEGRKEQALRTDQDNAILFEDPPKGYEGQAREYFLELGRRVTKGLNECGFAYCKGEVMASNPKWCASLSEWKENFRSWIESPTPKAVMHFAIFFDLRGVCGEVSIVGVLEDWIQELICKNSSFLRFLALNAVSSTPPLGIFRGFAVERHGEHKDSFDIKARGIVPIVDSARVLSLEMGIRAKNTIERWKALAERAPERKEEFNELSVTFEILSRIRMKNYLKNPSYGNYLNPNSLSKIDKETMKNAFEIIREMQRKIEVHFRLDLISH